MVREEVQVIGHAAASPSAVWALAGDFCAAWHPAIDRIAAERDGRGALIRAFTVKGEDTVYREQLVYRSDSDRVLTYTHLEGIAGVDRYVARLAVSAEENGGSRIEWSAEFMAAPDRAAAIAAGTRVIFDIGLKALAEEAAHAGPPPSVLPDISPSRGAIDSRRPLIPISTSRGKREASLQPISPLEGEMPGRAEGGTICDSPLLETTLLPGTPPLALTVTPPQPGSLTLFLHGIGGGRTNWLRQLQATAPHIRAAALDLRGYGDSTLGPSQSTIEDYCDDILRVADALGASRLVLCGLSYGSWIATSFAMRYPEKLAGLVLSGGCTGMSEASVEEREAFRQSREVPLNAGQTPADFAPNVVKILAGPDAGDAVKLELLASMSAIPAATYRDALHCFTHPPERFDFSRLTMPVLMMTGEHDRLAPPAEIRGVAGRIAALAPNASVRFEAIAGAGHVCNVENPGAYNSVLGEFLSELPR